MDPFTLTQHWYWDDYYTPWLNSAYHTKFFMTTLNKEHFDSAKADGSKFQVYFSDTSKVYIALHSIFPNGTCIGGRAGGDDPLAIGKVYGFISNDKKGFIYITPDQSAGWPWPLINHNTKVDIVKEK